MRYEFIGNNYNMNISYAEDSKIINLEILKTLNEFGDSREYKVYRISIDLKKSRIDFESLIAVEKTTTYSADSKPIGSFMIQIDKLADEIKRQLPIPDKRYSEDEVDKIAERILGTIRNKTLETLTKFRDFAKDNEKKKNKSRDEDEECYDDDCCEEYDDECCCDDW